MTNAIEQAKREMYDALRRINNYVKMNCHVSVVKLLKDFNDPLESYLEQVRQDHEALHETARKRFEDVQALEAANDKLSKALRYTNETIQRCAAQSLETIRDLESKVKEQDAELMARQARIGELYSEVQQWKDIADAKDILVGGLRQERDDIQLRLHAIDHAYNEQQKKTGTCSRVCGDRGASEQPDANTMAILGVVVDCQQLVSDWAVYGYRAKKQMKKMAYALNNNPELRVALDHFEGKQ